MTDNEKTTGVPMNSSGELSDDELNKVSGGFGQYFGNDNCGDWTCAYCGKRCGSWGTHRCSGYLSGYLDVDKACATCKHRLSTKGGFRCELK